MFPKTASVKDFLFLLLVCGGTGYAQVAVRPQFETAQATVSEMPNVKTPTQGEVHFLPDSTGIGDSGDIGEQWVFHDQAKPKEISATLDLSANHTSNVALSSKNEEQDQYLVGQIAVSWQHPLTGELVFDIGLQEAFFRYNDFTELNFDSLNLGCGLTAPIPSLPNVSWYARYNYNRLSSENFGSELYNSHSLLAGAQAVFQLSRADSVFVGVSAQVNFSDPSDLERREYGVYGGYTLAITRSLSCDAIYRASLYDYSDRLDFNQTLSVALRWHPTTWFTVSGTASGTLNRSDESTFDYDLFNAGLSLTAGYQF